MATNTVTPLPDAEAAKVLGRMAARTGDARWTVGRFRGVMDGMLIAADSVDDADTKMRLVRRGISDGASGLVETVDWLERVFAPLSRDGQPYAPESAVGRNVSRHFETMRNMVIAPLFGKTHPSRTDSYTGPASDPTPVTEAAYRLDRELVAMQDELRALEAVTRQSAEEALSSDPGASTRKPPPELFLG